MMKKKEVHMLSSGLQNRVGIGKLFSLFLIQKKMWVLKRSILITTYVFLEKNMIIFKD